MTQEVRPVHVSGASSHRIVLYHNSKVEKIEALMGAFGGA
jgi:hypothetical protein